VLARDCPLHFQDLSEKLSHHLIHLMGFFRGIFIKQDIDVNVPIPSMSIGGNGEIVFVAQGIEE
jgi:hypothetical protein